MNLKRTLFTGVAAVGLMASIATPLVSAQNVSDSATTDAVVTVTEGGSFDVVFCNATYNLGTVPSTSVTNVDVTGTLQICYDDTLTYHNSALVSLQATSFTSTDAQASTPILASNFVITRTNNTEQEHYLSDLHGHTKVADPGYLDQNGGNPPQNATVSVNWTANNSLDVARNANYIYNGSGAGDTTSNINVKLTVPGGTAAGSYESEVTLTVGPGGPTH